MIETTNRHWILYIHTNKENGKSYVGITSQDPELRWMNGKGYESRLVFGRAIRKYGWENFEHEIVMRDLSEEDAKFLEKWLIKTLKTQDRFWGYNMTSGGDGVVGYHHTQETKRKLSEFQKGERHVNYGKHLSESTKRKIGEKNKGNKYALGVVRSKETKEKMSNSKKKAVQMFDGGNLVKEFISAKDAQEATGISRKNISLCCLGYRKHAGGYSWKFA